VSHSEILWRIDDRLIHGQIIIGWCGQLPIGRLVVCDDEIARTSWEKNLMLMAAPSNLPTDIHTVTETAGLAEQWSASPKVTLVLVKSPTIIGQLLEEGVKIKKVNVGGIHYREDRKEYLPYLYLSDSEIDIFKDLMIRGISFECQDVPTAHTYDLAKLLKKK
jgi:mannose/fructose/N-acetylgalactosamine-specific phosphotransferase system component IIB